MELTPLIESVISLFSLLSLFIFTTFFVHHACFWSAFCLHFRFIAYELRSQLGEFVVMMSWDKLIYVFNLHSVLKNSLVQMFHHYIKTWDCDWNWKWLQHLEISSCLLVFHIWEMRRRPKYALVNLVTLPLPSGIAAFSLSTLFYFKTRYKFNRQIS